MGVSRNRRHNVFEWRKSLVSGIPIIEYKDKNGTWYVSARYTNWKGEADRKVRKLDRYAKRPAVILAYVLGGIMTLHFGAEIFLISKDLLIGLALAIFGTFGMALNYPLYEKLLNKAKRRYAFEIVELAKDICRYSN